jgi:hypothetical protein
MRIAAAQQSSNETGREKLPPRPAGIAQLANTLIKKIVSD